MKAVRHQEIKKERREERRKVLWALLISLLFHIDLILIIAWLYKEHRPAQMLVAKKEEIQVVTMNLVSPPRPSQYSETTPNQATGKPSGPTFLESDKDTRAASPLPATGQMPLPTLNGKESPLEAIQFEDKKYSPGKQSGGTPPSMASHTPHQAQEEQQQKQTNTNSPVPKSHLPILKPLAEKRAPEEKSLPTTPNISSPSPSEQPGYQAETRVVRIDGNISNRGPAAMDVVATPLGRYKKLLSTAVGARWYYLIQRDMELFRIGTVVIRFNVQQNGKIEAVKIISNTSNELLAATSIQSIKDAEMPPIPPEVAASLLEGRIEVDYTFSIISN